MATRERQEKLGVCCVTTGPGVTNAATGLAVANFDSIPVLLISSQVHSEAARTRRGLFHAMNQLALTKPITKWNGRAGNPEQIPQALFGSISRAGLADEGAQDIWRSRWTCFNKKCGIEDSKLEWKSVEDKSEPQNLNAEIGRTVEFVTSGTASSDFRRWRRHRIAVLARADRDCGTASGACADESDGQGFHSRRSSTERRCDIHVGDSGLAEHVRRACRRWWAWPTQYWLSVSASVNWPR